MADANSVVNYFLATEKPLDFNTRVANVNGDDGVTMADANQIVNMFLNGVTTEILEDKSDAHDYVDLGLSVKWATCNVGATVSSELGSLFAWGETEQKFIFLKIRTNGNSIFLPSPDYNISDEILFTGSNGDEYWSSTLAPDNKWSSSAYGLTFDGYDEKTYSNFMDRSEISRYYPRPVRPVKP